jgi:hypothetical protein
MNETPHRDRFGNRRVLDKLAPDEPFFILRGQDAFAATLVSQWADMLEGAGGPRDKIDNARQCARAMRNYPKKKIPD